MSTAHEFLKSCPVDLYHLHLLRLVGRSGSFTKAAAAAGLTQSAMTRQVQGIEALVGTRLFERTTRRVVPTAAGEFLLARAEGILEAMGQTLQEVQEQFAGAAKVLTVGVSRSVGLAYLPGFFVAYRRRHPEVRVRVKQLAGAEVLAGLEGNELQAGIVTPPARLPAGLEVAHRFTDELVAIAPAEAALPREGASLGEIVEALAGREFLLIDDTSSAGGEIRRWMASQGGGPVPVPAMEGDTFDLMINLVTLGLGWSIVPRRALPLYPRARGLRRVTLRPRLTRELAIVVRKDRARAEHVRWFVEETLFGGMEA